MSRRNNTFPISASKISKLYRISNNDPEYMRNTVEIRKGEQKKRIYPICGK